MAEVLLIGPDRERAAGVRSLLRQDGHNIAWLRSVEGWSARERAMRPDIVVVAVDSPAAVLDQPTHRRPGFATPLLLVQQETDFMGLRFVAERLVDRIASPFMEEELLARVDALVRVRRVVTRCASDRTSDPQAARGLSGRLGRWVRSRLPSREKPIAPYLEVAARVAEWADQRDAFEPGHASRVAAFSEMIAGAISMEHEDREDLMRAAMLHDIGKVALPVEVLHQPGPLADGQLRLIRTHPARGAAVLRALEPDDRVARLVLYHHERPDGEGYYGKPSESVPQAAHVLAVAEAYDAMTSSRVRQPLDTRQALEQLQSVKGRSYDADCVEALVDQLKPSSGGIPLSLVPDPRV